MSLATVGRSKCFGGIQGVYSHDSTETHGPMRFGLYLPPAAEERAVPLLVWLSGLTCTEENFITKAGLEVKVQRKYYKLTPVDKKVKVPGARGQALVHHDVGVRRAGVAERGRARLPDAHRKRELLGRQVADRAHVLG